MPILEYRGSFEENLFHGYGEMVLQNEGSYQGHFEDGKRSGNGKYETFATTYEGMWEADLMHGPGSLTDRIKSIVFTGQMERGLKKSGSLKC